MEASWVLLLLLVGVSSQVCKPFNEKDCGVCMNSYFFDNSCLPCEQAKDEYSCEQCKGFYFRNGQCLPCSSLTNPGLCQECRGYFFTEGKCQPCELASPYLCTLQCPDYFLNRGSCTYCGLATDQLTCKFCPAAFQFKDRKCQQCPKHHITSLAEYQCMACSGVSNAIICSRCAQFYFANNTCSPCSGAKDARLCSKCPQFYFQGGVCKHCSEAGKKDCGFCKGFTLEGQFCVPCRLVSNSTNCQSCQLYRFSTDRQMCVPCQQKGYFLNEQGFCQHCLTAITQQTCDSCPGYLFDKRNRTCFKCSQLVDSTKCNSCLNYYFQKASTTCELCANANMLNCILYCSDNFFYSKNNCTSCEEAKSQNQCRSCAPNFYWSGSGKCMFCHFSDFFIKEDRCVTCASATSAQQCWKCPLYTFSSGVCRPCKYANTSLECSDCRSNLFYFTDNHTCSPCVLASQSSCNSLNCPSFGYYNGSCLHTSQIDSQAACTKFPFFNWEEKKCKYCNRLNEYLNPITISCIKCQNIRTYANCSLCPAFYFNEQKSSCLSCSSIKNEQSCSKCINYAFVKNRNCIPCANLTKKSDCAKCPAFLYRKGECVSCSEALSLEECRRCQNYTFQRLVCRRCETVTNMNNCEKYCVPQGYFPARNQGLCLPCFAARNENNCLLCSSHNWDKESQTCLNCSKSMAICQKCIGMYWNEGACRLCPPNCNRCSADGKICLQCKASYLLRNNSICQKVCNAQFCHQCTHNSSEVCEQCKPDYDFQGSKGLCSINCMVARCLTCSSNLVCQICEKGYTLQEDGLICRCSIEFCDSCTPVNIGNGLSTSTICNRCILGYTYDSQLNTCNKINCQMEICQLCRNENSCDVCKFGWNLTSGTCTPICNIIGCDKCSSAITCESCETNFKLIDEKQCQPICNVANCLKCSSFTTCQVCKDDYSLSKNFANCSQLCMPGFYDQNGTCRHCENSLPYCLTCQVDQKGLTCKKCQLSYANINGQCVPCTFVSPNCVNCFVQNSNFFCSGCAFGHSFVGRQCRKCSDHCVTCQTRGDDDCDTCAKGYVYNPQALNQIKCIPCLNNCMECQQFNITNCVSCFDEHYLHQGKCFTCPSNCKTCTKQNNCTTCIEGYLLGTSGCIMKKIPFCKSEQVDSNGINTQCLLCESGYYHIGNSCFPVACSTPGSNCTACPPSQYLSQGMCIPCPQIYKCESCDTKNPSKCETCVKSFYLDRNGQCYSCMSGCQVCVTKGSCKAALPGYYLLSGVNLPIKCPIECTTCQNQYVCGSCANGYVPYRKKCISSQAIKVNITVKPMIKDWNQMNVNLRYKNLFVSWSLYQVELMKLIGYEGRQDMVYVDAVSVGSITFNLVIDKLPAESPAKMINKLQESINKESKTLKVISYKKEEISESSTNLIQKQSSNQNPARFIIILAIILASIVLCILILLYLRRNLKHRVIPAPVNPQAQNKLDEMVSYNPMVKRDSGSDHSSDKDTKMEKKAEQRSQNSE